MAAAYASAGDAAMRGNFYSVKLVIKDHSMLPEFWWLTSIVSLYFVTPNNE